MIRILVGNLVGILVGILFGILVLILVIILIGILVGILLRFLFGILIAKFGSNLLFMVTSLKIIDYLFFFDQQKKEVTI